MRLTIIGPVYPYRGGIAHFTASLAHAASKKNAVQVVSFSRLYPQLLYPGKTDRDPSELAIQFPASEVIDTMNPLSWRRGASFIAQHKSDMVVFQWWTTFLAPCFIGLMKHLPSDNLQIMFLIHNVLPHEPKMMDRWLAHRVLRKADGFIVQTQREKERLLTILPDVTNQIEICPHPVYDSFSPIQITKQEARSRLNLPVDLPILLFFGFIREYKGVKQLLESLAILRDQGEEVFALLAGEIWDGKEGYFKKVADLGLEKLVRFDNRYIPNEDVPLYFSAADLFAAPYTQGTQSGSVRIALHFGLPIVATDRITYGLEEAGSDVLISVPADNPEAFAHGISEMLGRSPGDDKVKDAGGGLTDWDDLADSIKDLYIKIQHIPETSS